jgi:hypothetical protein
MGIFDVEMQWVDANQPVGFDKQEPIESRDKAKKGAAKCFTLISPARKYATTPLSIC